MQNLRCKNHPSENITNFCTRQECLVELCATCICHHTEMHGLNGTLPHYENINQTYKRAHEAIDIHRAEIQSEKKRIIQFNQIWQKRKELIYQTVQLAKKDVLELVQRTFAELEHKYTQTVHEEEIRLGMKSCDKVMKMLEAHNSESEKLFNLQKDLASGVKGPEIPKLLFTVFLPQNKELTNKIGEDFATLASYDINLEYLQNNLLDLKQRIQNLLHLEIHYPENLERVPLVQVVEKRPVSIMRAESPMYKTASSAFFPRPQSVGKPMKGSVIYVNGNSQLLIENKPKISVISGRLKQNPGASQLLLKNARRTIFPERTIAQIIR